jgi:hypothetical protein
MAMGNLFASVLMPRLARAGLLVGSLLGNAVHAQVLASVEPPGDVTADAFDEALIEYERCHWAAAWELLARLADRGHPRAARLALDMHRFGPRLFGGAFSADAARLASWETSRRSG